MSLSFHNTHQGLRVGHEQSCVVDKMTNKESTTLTRTRRSHESEFGDSANFYN